MHICIYVTNTIREKGVVSLKVGHRERAGGKREIVEYFGVVLSFALVSLRQKIELLNDSSTEEIFLSHGFPNKWKKQTAYVNSQRDLLNTEK